MAEVEQLRRVLSLMESGYSISRAVERIRAEEEHENTIDNDTERYKWPAYRQRLIEAVDRFDTTALETAYNEPLTLFPIDLIIDEVLLPVLEQIGDEWQERNDGIAREHFFSGFLRNKIGTRFNHEVQRRQGPALILTCLPDEVHELGLMLAGLVAAARGYRVLYLGSNLPLAQLQPVVAKTSPAGIVLSGTTVELNSGLEEELRQLVRSVQTPVYIGGDLAENHPEPLRALGIYPVGRNFRHGIERIIQDIRERRSAE
jgi:cobalamin-dependent methionine synthase I